MKKPKPIWQCVQFPLIVKDPARMFGSPTINGTRKTASVIGGFICAGDDPAFIASEYDLTVEEVNQAYGFKRMRPKDRRWKKIGVTSDYIRLNEQVKQ